jgi:dipeptidyl-peptidase-4
MRALLILFFFLPLLTLAQKKKLTLEDIYRKGVFRSEYVPGFEQATNEQAFKVEDLQNDKGEKIKADDYLLNKNKTVALVLSDREPIYRYSERHNAYIYDINTKRLLPLQQGKIMYPTFSPDGTRIAYVFENNIYLYNIADRKITPVTTDGKWNNIINGGADWVYEEEFGVLRAYEWSLNGNYIAYYKFDESKVKEYNMTLYNSQYNTDYRYKYPKAGEDNSKVSIHIYNTNNGNTVAAQYEQDDIYIPRIKWTQSDDQLVVYWMNRHQNNLKLLRTNAATGVAAPIYEETNKYYVDITDNWWFLKDGKNILFTSEMNGFNQLYLYSIDGSKKIQVSKLKYDIDAVSAVDEKNKLVYYTLAYPTPMDRQLFVSDFEGKNTKQLTTGAGWHTIEFNSDLTQFYDRYSTINTPATVTLYSIKGGKTITTIKQKTLGGNNALKSAMAQYELATPEFMKIPNTKGDTLNAWILKPSDFNAQKKYPVLFYNYGGPGSQYVVNRFGAVSFWHRLLAQEGFIVVSVDNTGTGFRGEEFKKKTYLQLGKLEIEDQIDAASYLSKLPYIDKARIGHYGWSYGGFMSALAITRGADVFKAAVAGAPVTSWRFYDNIYTERYMRTPKENVKGYDENSPLNYVDKLKGKFLIIHGTGDDNVHFQNSVVMVDALIKKNITFESFYFPNRNHNVPGTDSYYLWNMITNWLVKNLKEEQTHM